MIPLNSAWLDAAVNAVPDGGVGSPGQEDPELNGHGVKRSMGCAAAAVAKGSHRLCPRKHGVEWEGRSATSCIGEEVKLCGEGGTVRVKGGRADDIPPIEQRANAHSACMPGDGVETKGH
jgi:hypothetical protein